MQGKLSHEKTNCRLTEKIPKEEWCANKSKPRKKKANAQQIETSDKRSSESKDSSEESIEGDAIVPCSGAHALG